MISAYPDEYSAPVSLRLHVAGEIIELAMVGPERVVLKQPRLLPSIEAELEIKIGSSAKFQTVVLDAQSGAPSTEVKYW